MARSLGKRQRLCLEALARHGGWPGGWVWGCYSTTAIVLESLVKRGLASRHERERTVPYPGVDVSYRITVLGHALAKEMK